MVKVTSAEEAKKRYEQAASIIPDRYKAGISAVVGWKEAALKGQKLFEEQMRKEEVLKRRAGAISKLDENKDWKNRALEKGAAIIGEAIRKSVEKQAEKWAPYREALEKLTLPERSADPMANIDNRLKAVVKTLVEKRKELTK